MAEYALLQSAADAAFYNGASGTVDGDTAAVEFPAYVSSPPLYMYLLEPQTVPFTPTYLRFEIEVESGTGQVRPNLYFPFVDPESGIPYADLYGWEDYGNNVTTVSPGIWTWSTEPDGRPIYGTTLPDSNWLPAFLESLAVGVDGPSELRLASGGPLTISRFQIIVYTLEDEATTEPPLRVIGRNDGLAASSTRNLVGTRSRQYGLRAGPGGVL